MQVFRDRADAGRRLAVALSQRPELQADGRVVVLAIPRGGLPVGVEVARVLDAAFDVVVVRKLRTPHNPELGFGAVGPDGHADIDEDLVRRIGIAREEIEREIEDRTRAVEERLELFGSIAPPVDLRDAVAVIVDDGIATGGTARQACAYARRAGAARVILAAPVAPERVVHELGDAADAVVVLSQPAEFLAVGQVYQDFAQLDDDAVLATLHAGTRQRAD